MGSTSTEPDVSPYSGGDSLPGSMPATNVASTVQASRAMSFSRKTMMLRGVKSSRSSLGVTPFGSNTRT
jgi:hypothetical protein